MENKQVFKQVSVIDYSFQGLGVVKINNFTVFVEGVKKGEVIDIEITDVRKSFAFGKVINSELPKVACEFYHMCGGCNIMHLTADEQNELKANTIESQMHKHLIKAPFEGVVRSDNEFNYRNKITMPINYVDGQLKIGFYRASSHRFTPVDSCLIADQNLNNLIKPIENILNKLGEYSYNYKTNRGNLRHLIIRGNEKNIMVTVVTKNGKLKNEQLFIDEVSNLGVSSIVINKHPERSRQILGNLNRVVYGNESIELELANRQFDVKASAFFQVNKYVTNEIVSYISSNIDFQNTDVLDAFCGTGTLGQLLASDAKSVTGIELDAGAVEAARANAQKFNLQNCNYLCGDIEKIISQTEFENQFDIAIVDPPRSGMAKVMKSSLLTMRPKQIVYVACDPSTMMRDISELKLNYEVTKIKGFDMFPNTHHVETVAFLKLREE